MSDIRKRTGKRGTTYQVRYPCEATKTGYAYKTFDTMKEARAFTENLGTLSRVERDRQITVPEAIQKWLDICEKIGRDGRETVEPETLKEYRRRARVMEEYHWDRLTHELEPADVVRFRNWLLETRSRDLARRTLSSFHSVLIEMKHHGYLNSDPAAGITVKSGGRYEDDEDEIQIPTDEEMRAILNAADQMGEKNNYMRKCWARYRPLIYLAAFSGMRPSEYRGLSWSDVHEDHVLVRQRADRTGKIGPVKSRAGRRKIFLPSFVVEMLRAWQEVCPASEADLVFPTRSGKPMLLNSVRFGAWVPLLKEVGLTDVRDGAPDLPKYSPYSLRHYYASKLIESKKDLKFIQQAMGHSKIEVTFNVYGHLIRGQDDQHKLHAEELAATILGAENSCGKSVATAR